MHNPIKHSVKTTLKKLPQKTKVVFGPLGVAKNSELLRVLSMNINQSLVMLEMQDFSKVTGVRYTVARDKNDFYFIVHIKTWE